MHHLRRVPILVLLALTAAGCPKTPEAGGPTPTAGGDDLQLRVDALRAEAKALLHAQADLYWRGWALGEEVDLAQTYAGHEGLFTKESIALVDRARKATRSDGRRLALQDFHDYLVGEWVAKEVAPLNDALAEAEASAVVTVDGAQVPYRDLGRLLADARDASERQTLSDAALPVVKHLDALVARKQQRTDAVVRALGYRDYVALSEALRDADLHALAKMARAVLDRTDALYAAALDRVARRELGYGAERVRRADVPRLFRAAGVDDAFPADAMLPRLTEVLEGLGLTLDADGRIDVDAEPLPRKNPRAVCLPVDVPSDVRLSIKPAGGVSDYESLFHEMGHAQHFAHVTTKTFEFQQLGGNVGSETWAFLLEGLLADPTWLSGATGLSGERLDRFVEGQALRALYMVRRYAAKVLFELAWHEGRLEGKTPGELYRTLLSRAYGFPLDAGDARRWRLDHDDFFYSADYLRAWILEAQAEDVLVRRFGKAWWTSPEAGAFLRDLWADGTRDGADALARRLGVGRLDPGALLGRFEARLAPPGA